MSQEFDFRDMLGGASAKVGDPDLRLKQIVASGMSAMMTLGPACIENNCPPEMAIGWMMSHVAACARDQLGEDRAMQVLADWQSLIECLRAPGGLDCRG